MKVGMRMGVVCSVVAFGCVDPADPMDPMDPMDPGSVTCGEGTVLVDGMCVGLSCGPGTHRDGNACVRDDGTRYELRVYSTEIPANGYSKSPVLVIGTKPDGTPATDQVVLNTDRAGAGSFLDPAPVIGPLGTMAQFVPCNATTPGCTGPLRLTLALAGDPATELVGLDVELIEPMGVASTASCMVAAKAMYFDGNDYIYNGMMTVTDAVWGATGSSTRLSVNVDPAQMGQGLWWYLDFDSSKLGVNLVPGVYEMAQRWPFNQPGHPGLSISGDGRGCNTLTGRFQVHQLELQAGTTMVQRALVSFEQHCEGGANMLSGCIRFEL